jgi:ribosomal protein S18 acetylase RimI-like enzyme
MNLFPGLFLNNDFFMQITYKERDNSYVDFIKELFFQYKTVELLAFNWPREVLVSLLEMQFKAQEDSYRKQFPNANGFIIEIENVPVGWLLLNKTDTYHIVNIIIHNNFQGKGIGSQVIKELIEQANVENKKVTLKVDKNNPALKLYSSLGFKIICTEELFLHLSN